VLGAREKAAGGSRIIALRRLAYPLSVRRVILLYGLSGGLLIAALRYIEYRFLVVEHSIEIYGALIAVVFAAVGIRLGLSFNRRKEVVVVREAAPAGDRPFTRNDAKVTELGLTPRELEILDRIASGLSTRQIAEALFVSENTVKTHASRLFDKLGVNRRTQAVHVARTLGIIP
jgi:DNA-binding CsgD family transcriptional regulator